MPLSTDVNLPRDHEPQFADRCVVCGCESPDSSMRLVTGSIGWWTWALWIFGDPFSVRVPACKGCGWRLHFHRFASFLLTCVLIYIAFWHVWPLVKIEVSPGLQKWIMLGLAVLCVLPQVIYELFFPHAFCITAFTKSVDYEFRDEDAAYEFAALNDDADWVKIT